MEPEEIMSKCAACGREMQTADGCILTAVYITHNKRKIKTMDPIPFGNETRYPGWTVEAHERCHDCNVKKGEFHHPGCDWEECPNCRSQMIMCGGECGGKPN
jgi:hypothetical protein